MFSRNLKTLKPGYKTPTGRRDPLPADQSSLTGYQVTCEAITVQRDFRPVKAGPATQKVVKAIAASRKAKAAPIAAKPEAAAEWNGRLTVAQYGLLQEIAASAAGYTAKKAPKGKNAVTLVAYGLAKASKKAVGAYLVTKAGSSYLLSE